jgi:hypothetical protein
MDVRLNSSDLARGRTFVGAVPTERRAVVAARNVEVMGFVPERCDKLSFIGGQKGSAQP